MMAEGTAVHWAYDVFGGVSLLGALLNIDGGEGGG